jgi:hypothetical protein
MPLFLSGRRLRPFHTKHRSPEFQARRVLDPARF